MGRKVKCGGLGTNVPLRRPVFVAPCAVYPDSTFHGVIPSARHAWRPTPSMVLPNETEVDLGALAGAQIFILVWRLP